MKNWQKDRNYRKYKTADGSVVYVVTIDGTDVEVSKGVYEAYSQSERRERYCEERDAGRLLSLEQLDEDKVQLAYLTDEHVEAAEDTAMRGMMTEQMLDAVKLLTEEERELLHLMFVEDIPARELARQLGVYHRTVIYRRDRILKKLKYLMGE